MNPTARARTAAALRAAAKALEAGGLGEDEHEDTPFAEEVKDVLARYQEQHD